MTDKKTDRRAEGEAEVRAAIEAMAEPDRGMGERLHALVMESVPSLMPRTWYGMPAYTDGNKIYFFFRSRQKFGERYMTLGFNDVAQLDEGNMWPVTYALTELTDTEARKIAALLQKAVGR